MGEHPPRLVYHHYPARPVVGGKGGLEPGAATQVMTTGRAGEWYRRQVDDDERGGEVGAGVGTAATWRATPKFVPLIPRCGSCVQPQLFSRGLGGRLSVVLQRCCRCCP